MRRSTSTARALRAGALASAVALLVVVAGADAEPGEEGGGGALAPAMASALSSGPVTRYLIAHPELAPESVRTGFEAMHDVTQGDHADRLRARDDSGGEGRGVLRQVFNRDDTGLPQNEESVTQCRHRPKVVMEGTNDYRGLLDPLENFTGWHLSTDGGRHLAAEGLLPAIDFGDGTLVPSGGDPVALSDENCTLYLGDLNYDPATFFPNGIGLYQTTPRQLLRCPGGADPSCWPKRVAVAQSQDPHVFLDKPWMYVGRSAGTTYIWVVYTRFVCPDVGCTGTYTSNSIQAVRCTTDLVCSDPVRISGDQQSIQFGDVTIGPDGRTYVTWEQDNDLETDFQPPETMRFWMRVAPPGSMAFGPAHLVAQEPKNLGIADLHANDFRIATYPKSDVKMVHGHPRAYVVWEGCRARVLGDSVCEEPAIKLRYSDDQGATWSGTRILSRGGDNYFPTISANPGGRGLAVAWFTSRFDPIFHNRQDVELARVSLNGHTQKLLRLTRPSNDPEADPLLGGAFIGDYIETYAQHDRALVAYNANYRSVRLLGEGFPIPQQDNYLARARF